MAKNKRGLMATILLVALVHVPQMALTPGIARIKTDAFPEYSLLVIQSAVTLPCLLSVVSGIVSAVLIRFGKLTRKAATVIGLALFGAAGLFTLFFHAHFFQLILAGLMLGWGTGMFVPNITSILIDNFDERDRKLASGLQGASASFGGIVLSFFAGLLVTYLWYGGYLMLLLGLPICAVCIANLPAQKASGTEAERGPRRKLPIDVLYFSSVASFLFVMMFASFSNNLSSHFQAAGIVNYSAMAGIGIAINMFSGFLMGLFFNKLSMRYGDYLIAAAFVFLAAGFFLVGVFTHVLPLMLVGAFISGMAICLATPQGIVSMSRYVDESNSFFATMLFNCVMNGMAGFLSAPVLTGITQLIAGDDTVFRYNFIALLALAIGLAFAWSIARRAKRGAVWR
ncbi:MAG: MFS transporter [Clostridiales Family XIII bacterium]|jgi:MFS family permease|nr:MFS transporter [Clostridiales Family XIII bacterium]